MAPFNIHLPTTGQRSAIVFDTPHSGVILPDHFRRACADRDLMHLHDPHVEKLLARVPDHGVPVLEALIHRTCIDLNRFDDEINTEIILDGWPGVIRKTRHTDAKLGLFPVRAGPRSKRDSDIYSPQVPLTAAEARLRIQAYHTPYYAALNELMNTASALHNRALHINVHSFYRHPDNPRQIEDIILGDMNGTTCPAEITGLVAAFMVAQGFSVSFNGLDFSGGALIQTTAKPARNHHSLQIEIARDLYMDPDNLEFNPVKGKNMARTMAGLSQILSCGIR